MTDMRTLIRDQSSLALIYAEDGAYGRAGQILEELAKVVKAHAAGLARADMVHKAQLEACIAEVRQILPGKLTAGVNHPTVSELTEAAEHLAMLNDDRRPNWTKRDDRTWDHANDLVTVKRSHRGLDRPWYIMSRGKNPGAHKTQVRGRYFKTHEAAMIAAEVLSH